MMPSFAPAPRKTYVSARQRERVRGYIEQGIGEGARVVTGGAGTPAGMDRGWYVRPTLFADVDSTMSIAQEEVFGPVLTVLQYTDIDDAVRLADDTAYDHQVRRLAAAPGQHLEVWPAAGAEGLGPGGPGRRRCGETVLFR